MKKIFTLMILASGFALGAQAQKDGFYHVMNNLTKRYMVMVDNTKGNTTATGGYIDMESVQTCSDLDLVNTHAGSVVYVKSVSGGYDVAAQGTSISALTGNKIKIQLTAKGDGFQIHGTYSGTTIYLGDATQSGKVWSYVKEASSKTGNDVWILSPIDNSTHFLGIKPDVKIGNDYFGSMFMGFSFKLHSEGMKAYYVDKRDDKTFSVKEITSDVIPAKTPVIIKCSSSDPKNNIIKPVTDAGTKVTGDILDAVYFDNDAVGHVNNRPYDEKTMRVIGDVDGKLGFVKATTSYLTNGKYMPHNKIYLTVDSSAADKLSQGSGASGIEDVIQDVETGDNAIYTLSGARLPKGVTPRPGIYIQNGKKVVFK